MLRVWSVRPWGQEGVAVIGRGGAEVWDRGERLWRLPSNGEVTLGVLQGAPVYGIGASRVRADGPVLLSMDLEPGRFTWPTALSNLAWEQCPAGTALTWTDAEGRWYALPQGDAVQIAHHCPPTGTPWPKGKGTPCTPYDGLHGITLRAGDLAVCTSPEAVDLLAPHAVVQVVRLPRALRSPR